MTLSSVLLIIVMIVAVTGVKQVIDGAVQGDIKRAVIWAAADVIFVLIVWYGLLSFVVSM